MSDNTPFPTIPPGALAIVRTVTATGTIYTVPAGRLLHIVMCFGAFDQGAGQGSGTITATPLGDASSRTLFAMFADANDIANTSTHGYDVPIAAGQAITGTITGAPTSARVGFIGWEEAA